MGRLPLLVVALGLMTCPPAVAQGERDATPAEQRRVVEALQALGYSRITDVDVVGGRFVVDARSPRGRDVDVELDRRTLRIIRERRS